MLLSMLEQMNRPPSPFRTITSTQYSDWQNGYVFDRLRDQRYGQSFCNHFGITDNILFFSDTTEQAHRYIMRTYVKE